MKRTEKHEFALYYKHSLDIFISGNSITLDDEDIVRRVLSVLRLEIDDRFILFNGNKSAKVIIESIKKRSFDIRIISSESIAMITPTIAMLLPLLKREALESALYNATAMGVTTIQLVTTEKSVSWSGQKEMERLQRVTVAAAEQSKQFFLPHIKSPINVTEYLASSLVYDIKIHPDVEGGSCKELVTHFTDKKSFLVSVGPEGDFTKSERDLLQQSGFIFTRLTPTVLKAEEAASLLIGIIRSFT